MGSKQLVSDKKVDGIGINIYPSFDLDNRKDLSMVKGEWEQGEGPENTRTRTDTLTVENIPSDSMIYCNFFGELNMKYKDESNPSGSCGWNLFLNWSKGVEAQFSVKLKPLLSRIF